MVRKLFTDCALEYLKQQFENNISKEKYESTPQYSASKLITLINMHPRDCALDGWNGTTVQIEKKWSHGIQGTAMSQSVTTIHQESVPPNEVHVHVLR